MPLSAGDFVRILEPDRVVARLGLVMLVGDCAPSGYAGITVDEEPPTLIRADGTAEKPRKGAIAAIAFFALKDLVAVPEPAELSARMKAAKKMLE